MGAGIFCSVIVEIENMALQMILVQAPALEFDEQMALENVFEKDVWASTIDDDLSSD